MVPYNTRTTLSTNERTVLFFSSTNVYYTSSLRYQHKMDYDAEFAKKEPWETFEAPSTSCNNADGVDVDPMPIFAPKPFAFYKVRVFLLFIDALLGSCG